MSTHHNPMDGAGSSRSNHSIIMEECKCLPSDWLLVPVNGKNPSENGRNWASKAVSPQQLVLPHWATGIGLLLGHSGLVAIDHDGPSASSVLEAVGLELPDTVKWTSGKTGRYQALYRIPESYQKKLSKTRHESTGIQGEDGKFEQLELRANGSMSVIPPSIHPDTGKPYQWINHPSDCAVTVLTDEQCELLLKVFEKKKKTKTKTKTASITALPAESIPILSEPEVVILEEQRISPAAYMEILKQAYGSTLRFNLLLDEVELNGTVLRESELAAAFLRASQHGFKISKETAYDAVIAVARKNSYHPVKEYLEGLDLDRSSEIDARRLASTFLRPEDKDKPEPTIYDKMLLVNLIGAVRRVFEPGCQHDTCCIFIGLQGAKKTSLVSAFAGTKFFCGDFRDPNKKDELLKLHRAWIIEWAELDQITGKKQASEVKHFLTVRQDNIRKPYAKSVEFYPRASVIFGTTNKQELLVDDTGNRRFHVVPVTAPSVDIAQIDRSRDDIWAAVYKLYRNGVPNYLSPEDAAIVDRLNLQYLEDTNGWLEIVEQWLTKKNATGEIRLRGEGVTIPQVLTEALKVEPSRFGHSRSAVKRILLKLGLVEKVLRPMGEDGKKRAASRRYVDPTLDNKPADTDPPEVHADYWWEYLLPQGGIPAQKAINLIDPSATGYFAVSHPDCKSRTDRFTQQWNKHLAQYEKQQSN